MMNEGNEDNNREYKKKKNKCHIHKINCNTCAALVSLFYSSSMSATVREAIICHLVRCNKCLEKYANYENNHKEFQKIKIKEAIQDIRDNDPDIDIDNIKIIATSNFDSDTDGTSFNPTRWSDAASRYDIEMLMNLKVFRDLINSYGNDTIDKNLDFSEFYKYITNKYAKRIDLLELCLRKEIVINS